MSSERRAGLAEAATEYALNQGLIGLSLRPLAAALGTSDRMLLYHFGSKDHLVATVLRLSAERSVEELRALPAAGDVSAAVHQLWAASQDGGLERCQRLYVEAAALGLLGREPYATVVREGNERWLSALAGVLVAAGSPHDRARRAALLVDAVFMGFQLDLPLERGNPELEQGITDLATTVSTLTAANLS